MFLRNTIRRAKAVKLKKPRYHKLITLGVLALGASAVYGVVSTIGLLPSFTFNYVYPYLKTILNLEQLPLHYSVISFEGQSISKFIALTALHFFDMFVYVLVLSKLFSLISWIIIRQRLGSCGYQKLQNIKSISCDKRDRKIKEVHESFSNIMLKHERTVRQEREAKQPGNIGTGLIAGFLLGLIVSR